MEKLASNFLMQILMKFYHFPSLKILQNSPQQYWLHQLLKLPRKNSPTTSSTATAHKYRRLFLILFEFFFATFTVIVYNEFILFASRNKQKKAARLCSLKMWMTNCKKLSTFFFHFLFVVALTKKSARDSTGSEALVISERDFYTVSSNFIKSLTYFLEIWFSNPKFYHQTAMQS